MRSWVPVAKRITPSYDMGINDLIENLGATLAASTVSSIDRGGANFRRLVELLGDENRDQEAIANVHKGIAQIMREATVSAYQENVLAHRAAPSYRKGDPQRDAGGALLRALRSQSMAVGDAEGISFVNMALLDSVARQWARLNFGASPGIGNTQGKFARPGARIRFGGGEGRTLRFAEGPGAPVVIPKGFFNEKNQFFPSKGTGNKWPKNIRIVPEKKVSEVGIGARRYLEAGLAALGNNYGAAFRTYFEEADRRAKDKAKQERLDNPVTVFDTRDVRARAAGFPSFHYYAKSKGWR